MRHVTAGILKAGYRTNIRLYGQHNDRAAKRIRVELGAGSVCGYSRRIYEGWRIKGRVKRGAKDT
ncbi:hypothetical protein [Nitrosospira multiformis]|uniref:hypothetical protein n=1 Tax=Nitrosospira multiformis TaxID=1231 RepID=UPI00115F8F15|nr:hypothetical protein [Nitrosospira multiformis]